MGDGFIAMTAEEAVNVSVYERANRSVVNISTTTLRPESLFISTEVEGNGSGIVLDQSGRILTNHHVIKGSKKVTVTIFNGDAYPATLVGQDADNDIAVLQINAPQNVLFPVPWGDSSNLRVGKHVIAIGNPFGFERTMTTGIISSLNRQLPSKTKHRFHSLIQVDAALNQGNSGGPLLNSRGELIGMNTAIATRSGDEFAFQSAHYSPLAKDQSVLIYSSSVRRNGGASEPVLGALGVVFNWEALSTAVLTNASIDAAEAKRTLRFITDRDFQVLASSKPMPADFRLPVEQLGSILSESKGHCVVKIDGKDACVAHALSPGFESYATGWRSFLIQELS
jgi:hypothetical protein